MIKILLSIYELTWFVALPFLKRSPRVALGWNERTLKKAADGPFDLWIQSASGGESLLTNMVLTTLSAMLPANRKLRILVSSGTKQGIDILTKNYEDPKIRDSLDITVAYFPFDAPHLMRQAFDKFAPKLAVIVETELWPGFLVTAKKKNIPVLLINGRMSEKSFRSYRHFSGFFKKYGPKKVLAISPLDRERFTRVVGPEKVDLMNNIKFDRIEPQSGHSDNNPIFTLLPEATPFILLGSIRQEEEVQILRAIIQLIGLRTDIIIGLFPKHIEHADRWITKLTKAKIKALKRSEATNCQKAGTVIVWDIFGELAGAYALARAAFVGGSLVNLGGQNFLEPLVFGLRPIIGPYWQNFAWVGQEIISSGLVQEVADENELVTELVDAIEADDLKDEVIRQVEDFFAPRKGGTQQVCQQIIDTLHATEKR